MKSPVVADFENYLNNGDSAPVSAIKALTLRLECSESETVMGIGNELNAHAATLKVLVRESFGNIYSIPVEAACQMFLKVLTRGNNTALVRDDNIAAVKKELVCRGKKFSEALVTSRECVAALGHKFVLDGERVLVHGYSRAVIRTLEAASSQGRRFDVLVTEARPDCAGYKVAKKLAKLGISHTLIVDAAVGYVMETVDMVLVGAEGILENGGITNCVGTYPLAVLAKSTKTNFYVCAESFKFSRVFPLNQREVGVMDTHIPDQSGANILIQEYNEDKSGLDKVNMCNVKNILTDYTPPEFISLIVTELGVLTPSAVSDELIKLYQ